MLAAVGAHVDPGGGHPGCRQHPLYHTFRIADKGVDGAVGGFSGIDIEQGATFGIFDGLADRRNGLFISAF